MTQNIRTAMLTLGLALIATAVVAAPTNVSASGQYLVVDGVGAQGATLKIAGPGGYRLIHELAAGERATIDLVAVTGPGGEAIAALSPGTYHYELISRPGGERTSGSFVVGETTGSGAELADPGQEAVTAHADAVAIQDTENDGLTALDFDSDGTTFDLHWTFVNENGQLTLKEHDTSSNNEEGVGTVRWSTLRGSNAIGIGTVVPLHSVDVADATPRINLSDTDGGSNWKLVNSGGQFMIGNNISCGFLCTTIDPIMTIEDGAPTDSLHIDATGQMGVGTASPGADFHLNNVDAAGDTVFKLVNAAEWNLGTTGTGVFTFNKAGTGGQEATFRNRNDALATLDVQGHVRGTSFKATSSRAVKTGFEELDATEVLAKVTELPVTSWRYRTEEEGVRHFGPVAEDFQRLFGLGDGNTIASVDADGVALAAIQGLNARLQAEVEAKDAEIEALEARLAAIEEQLAGLSP